MKSTITDVLEEVYDKSRFKKLAQRHGHCDAEDIRQETAIRAWRAAFSNCVEKPRGYVSSAMRSCVIDYTRRKKCRVPAVGDHGLASAKSAAIIDWHRGAELAINALPATEREAVRRTMEGMLVPDIAAKDHVQPATVRKRLSRARERIPSILDATDI